MKLSDKCIFSCQLRNQFHCAVEQNPRTASSNQQYKGSLLVWQTGKQGPTYIRDIAIIRQPLDDTHYLNMAFGNHPFDSSSSRELRHGIRPRFSLVCSSRTMGSSDGKKNDEDFLIGTRWSPEIMTFCRQAIIIFRDNLSWLVLVLSLLMNLAGSSRKLHHRARVCMQSWI